MCRVRVLQVLAARVASGSAVVRPLALLLVRRSRLLAYSHPLLLRALLHHHEKTNFRIFPFLLFLHFIL